MFKPLCTFLSILISLNVLAQTSNFAPSEGVNIHYRLIGEGSPILVINGGPGFNCEGFEPMATDISKMGYQTILYDQRGTGQSKLNTLDSSTITMDLMVKDIEAIRKHLSIDQWMILGHSFGGIMMNYYAAKHPNRVAGMIASSSGGVDLTLLQDGGTSITSRLTETELDSLSYWRGRMREGDTSYTAKLRHATFLAPAYVVDRKFIPVVAKRLTQGNMQLNGLVWSDLRRIDFDTKKELSSFDKPVLLIQGKEDVISTELATLADSVFSNSRVVLLDRSSHYGWLDNPQEYFGEINRFLSAEYPPKNDEQAVSQVLRNYIYSIYQTDSALVDIYSKPELQKSGYYYSRKKESWSYSSMTFAELQHTAATYNHKGWIPDWAPEDIELFEVKDKVASAKIKAIWGFDYVLLSKTDMGRWQIDKVLWQSYSSEERDAYFGELSAYTEEDATRRIEVGSITEPRILYRGSFSADGLEYYFFLKTGKGEKYRIFRSQNEGHEMVKAKELNLGNSVSSDLYPTISPDGNQLVFTSYRQVPDKGWPENAYLWYAEKKKGDQWSKPQFLGNLNQKGKYHSAPAFDASGNLVFRVTEANWETSTTYIAQKNENTYVNPQPYEPVNRWKNRLDDHYIWGGIPGHTNDYVVLDVSALSKNRRLPSDQWVSYLENGEWTYPVPLQKGINRRDSWDTFVFFNPGGSELYFIRDFTELRSIPISKVIHNKS